MQSESRALSRFATEDVPLGRRFAYFREVVCESFFRIALEALDERPCRGELLSTATRGGSLFAVRFVPSRVVRTPEDVRCSPDESVIVLLQLSGAGQISQDGGTHPFGPGDLVCYDSSRPYELSNVDEFNNLALMVSRETMLQRVGSRIRFPTVISSAASPTGAVVAGFLRNAASLAGTVGPEVMERLFSASIDLVAASLCEHAKTQGPYDRDQPWARSAMLYRAKDFIARHLQDPDLNTDTVGRALGVSSRYLQALFSEAGLTVSGWIWEQRLESSRQLLEDPARASDTIGEIAFACGFSDFAHFSHRFKERYGMSPRDFRRNSGQHRAGGRLRLEGGST